MCAPSPAMGMNQSNRGSGLRLMAGAYRGCPVTAGEPAARGNSDTPSPRCRFTEIMERGSLLSLAPLLVAAVLFLPGIGTRITSLEDEARYALKARTMLETGDWLLPRVDGEVQMQKSPLFMWAIALLSLPGRKVTELTATLPSALSAIAGVGMTLLLGRRMFGARGGLLAAFTLATMFGYYWHARLILADMMMTFFLVAAAAAFWMSVGDGASRRGPLIVFWACLALALSAKRPGGLLALVLDAARCGDPGGGARC